MKSAFLTGLQKLEVSDVPAPSAVGPHDCLLRIVCVGVCGSDVHYFSTGRIGEQVVKFPYRVGHECSAVVEATGDNVRRIKRGDLVAVDPTISCGDCEQCRAGRRNTCLNQKFLGCPGQIEGCLCEYMVLPEDCCFLAEGLTPEQAALAEPLSIGLYSVRSAGSVAGKKVLVQGSGAIGLSVILCCGTQSPAAIYATDKLAYRCDHAGRCERVAWTGKPEDLAVSQRATFDVVFECCGQQDAADQAVEMLKPGGKLLIVGIPECDRISFPIHTLRRKEITIVNVRRQNECEQETLDLIRSRRISPDFMMTHRFPLEQAAEAFSMVEGYRDGVLRALIDVSAK